MKITIVPNRKQASPAMASGEMYVTEKEAVELTGYKRTTLYLKRIDGSIRWTAALSGRKVRYHKDDLLKLIGLTGNKAA